jgi:hypothetical protein
VENLYCTICGDLLDTRETALGPHTPGWRVKTPATCAAEGVQELYCTVCGALLGATWPIAKLETHTPGLWETVNLPACAQTGLRELRCTVCDKLLDDEVIPATGLHTHTVWTVVTPATTAEQGEESSACDVCGLVVTRPIPLVAAIQLIPGANGVVVDNNIGLVYGVPPETKYAALFGDPNDPSKDRLLTLNNTNGVIDAQDLGKSPLGTGYLISVRDKTNGYKLIAQYTLVVFGDGNGDGHVDAMDVQYCTQLMSVVKQPQFTPAAFAFSFLSAANDRLVEAPNSTILGMIHTQVTGGNPIRVGEYAIMQEVRVADACRKHPALVHSPFILS